MLLDKVLKIFFKYPKKALISLLLICFSFSYFAFFLEVDASSESLLLENDKDLVRYEQTLKTFNQSSFLLLAYKPDNEDIFNSTSISKMIAIQNSLKNIQGIENILSVLNAPLFNADKDSIEKGANLLKAKEEILKNDFYKNNIINKDAKVGSFILFLPNNEKLAKLKEQYKQNKKDKTLEQEYKKELELSKDKLEQTIQDLKKLEKEYVKQGDYLVLGGLDMIASDMISYIKSDLLVYGVSLVLLLSFALYMFFRKISFVCIAIFVCIISLLCTSGMLVLLGYKITVISSNYVALVLIITLSVLVHLLSHFVEVNNKYTHLDNTRKIRHTLLFKAKPSFYAILTTVIGFLSLVFSGIKPIEDLGIMMSIGISVSLVLAYLFFASIFPLLKTVQTQNLKDNKKFLSFCANVAINHRKIVYLVSFIIVILTYFGVQKLKVENSFVNYFKDSSNIKQGLVLIDENLGGTIPLDIVLRFKENPQENKDLNTQKDNDEFDDLLNEYENESKDSKYFLTMQKLELIKKVHLFLEDTKYVGSVLSVYSAANFAQNITHSMDNFTLAYLQNNLGELKSSVITPYLNAEKGEVRFSMRIEDSDKTLKRAEFLKDLDKNLKELLKDDNVEYEISGIMLLYNNMLQSLLHSQVDTLSFVILTLFALFLIIFRNVRFSIIGIIANVVPLGLVFALIGFSGIPLDLMSITIAAISIGIGVDDIIHYVHKFRLEIRNYPLQEAIRRSHQSIGSALYYTTLTIVLGFGVMVNSNFIPTIYFGLLTVFVMLLLLCGSLFLLPSLIISFYFKGYFKKEKRG